MRGEPEVVLLPPREFPGITMQCTGRLNVDGAASRAAQEQRVAQLAASRGR